MRREEIEAEAEDNIKLNLKEIWCENLLTINTLTPKMWRIS
jgi:hypothetical protein